jgi:hypothetical protein
MCACAATAASLFCAVTSTSSPWATILELCVHMERKCVEGEVHVPSEEEAEEGTS